LAFASFSAIDPALAILEKSANDENPTPNAWRSIFPPRKVQWMFDAGCWRLDVFISFEPFLASHIPLDENAGSG
jgi:hypothetical protein